MKRAVCVMVLGTTSGAGKSWLTTALCVLLILVTVTAMS